MAGRVAEFSQGLDKIQLAVLDAVTNEESRVAGAAPTRTQIRTTVRNSIMPKPDINSANMAIEALIASHLQVLGGSQEPQHRVTLRGLLASARGETALHIIEKTFQMLSAMLKRDPGLFRYSWSNVREASSLPAQENARNLAYIALTNAGLGQGWIVTGDEHWLRPPPALDELLEEPALDYLRRLISRPASAPPQGRTAGGVHGTATTGTPTTSRVRAGRHDDQGKAPERQGGLRALDRLRDEFIALGRLENRQEAGLRLEGLLNELFGLAGLTPRQPFRVVGEQIDGSFELDNEIYIVEAKWERDAVSEAPLLVFRGKIEGKSAFTRGVFIALNGVTEPARDAITRGKQPNFFAMNGHDLMMILQGAIALPDFLRCRHRLLAEEGLVVAAFNRVLGSQ